MNGNTETKPVEHFIDCDEAPFIPEGWSILPANEQLPRRFCGVLWWGVTEVALHLSTKQKNNLQVLGSELCKELEEIVVYPANVLDFLLKKENWHLIPEEWEGVRVFFWGTIYCRSDDYLGVRCLCRIDDKWTWSCHWLDSKWSDHDLSAIACN